MDHGMSLVSLQYASGKGYSLIPVCFIQLGKSQSLASMYLEKVFLWSVASLYLVRLIFKVSTSTG